MRLVDRLRRPFGRLKLRHRLGWALSIAALLPVVVASWVALSVLFASLDEGLAQQTRRQLDVGVNLLLRNVERIGVDATRLSASPQLIEALARGENLARVLETASEHMVSSLIQVLDANGATRAERFNGGAGRRFADLRVTSLADTVRAAMAYERRVTIVPVGEVLAVRAVAPIVDDNFRLVGVVAISVPLDGEFVDGLKAALGSDVLVHRGFGDATGPGESTFLTPQGQRLQALEVHSHVIDAVGKGGRAITNESISGHDYSIGYTSLTSIEGQIVGLFGVATDRESLATAKRAAIRSLALGAAGAFLFALGLAGFISRKITGPVARLHTGAIAIARGDLDHRIEIESGDEFGDLARAFQHMTSAVKENQQRLRARMREIVALHDAGRAVSAVIDHESVLRKIVDSVARVLDVKLCALWVATAKDTSDDGGEYHLRMGAARARSDTGPRALVGMEAAALAEPLEPFAEDVAHDRGPVRVDRVGDHPRYREAAVAAGVTGSLVATPLERKGQIIGVIVVGRTRDAVPLSDADLNLLATFADQAAAAVENARLYQEVRAFNEELEGKVLQRTFELEQMNSELARTLHELSEAQAQLVLSERLAGLGMLVAGVAHEINSPSAAIRGAAEALGDNVGRLAGFVRNVSRLPVPDEARAEILTIVSESGARLATTKRPTAVETRRNMRELREHLTELGVTGEASERFARTLAELGGTAELLARIRQVAPGADAEVLMAVGLGCLVEYAQLHRNVTTVGVAIRKIQRIVGALKTYSHLDQEAARLEVDIHEGIDDTLVLLDHALRDITVERHYSELPLVPVFVDELNQVWTNLISNAVQAMNGEGNVSIETRPDRDGVAVRITDDGPGIDPELLPRIFDPFVTTKPKGEGTGLGLRIVRQIVDKHGGRVGCTSRPGETSFEVWLPRTPAEAVPASPAPAAKSGSARIQVSTGAMGRGDS